MEYHTHLGASIDCIKFLLHQGLAFCGDDEFEDSYNQGNFFFFELLQWLYNHNEDIKLISLKNAPENLELTSSKIQKHIINAISMEIVNSITRDIVTPYFYWKTCHTLQILSPI